MNRILLTLSCILLLGVVCLAEETVEVGKAAPDITLTGIDGKQFKLSETRIAFQH